MEAIRTEGLSKRFGATLALDGVSLAVPPGEVFGFLGPNGAGKSTAIRLLLGLIRPTAGRAWVFGDNAADVAAAHRHLAYVPADVALWPQLTGAECLELLARVGGRTDLAYRRELVGRFGLELDKRGRAYSTGNRQKVALVAAFATRAPLLVLDEPTSGLDPLMELEFRRCLAEAAERGQTVFLSSHQLGEVEAVCQRVGILRRGRLVEVAGMAELRRLRRTEVRVTFAGPAPDLAGLPGVSEVRDGGTGSAAAVAQRAAGAGAARDRGSGSDQHRGAGADAGGDLPGVLRRRRAMTTAAAQDTAGVPTRASAAGRAVTGLAVRQVRRGALVVLVVVAGVSALVAVQYRQVFADAFDAASLRALAENPAIRTLFGEPVALDDPGGFTVWRTGTFAAVLVGVWALLAATRITRGEEDAGRWDLLLAGRLSAPVGGGPAARRAGGRRAAGRRRAGRRDDPRRHDHRRFAPVRSGGRADRHLLRRASAR